METLPENLSCPDCGGPVFADDGDILCEAEDSDENVYAESKTVKCTACGSSDIHVLAPAIDGQAEMICDNCSREWTWEGQCLNST